MQLKEWYIDLEGKVEGPYSILDLRADVRITPDTLVWKEGFSKWVPIGSVKELEDVFKDPKEPAADIIPAPKVEDKSLGQDELVIDMSGEPPDFLWWMIILLILVYFLIQLYWA
jgi:hypothetical protein